MTLFHEVHLLRTFHNEDTTDEPFFLSKPVSLTRDSIGSPDFNRLTIWSLSSNGWCLYIMHPKSFVSNFGVQFKNDIEVFTGICFEARAVYKGFTPSAVGGIGLMLPSVLYSIGSAMTERL